MPFDRTPTYSCIRPSALALAAVMFATCLSPAVVAQTLDAEAKAAVIDAAADHLEAEYIYEDKGRELADALRSAGAEGRFDAATSAPDFGAAVTRFLYDASQDGHLRIWYGPELGGSSSRPRSRVLDRTHGLRGVEVLEGNVGYLDLRGFAGSDEAKDRADAMLSLLADVDALIIDLRRNSGGGPWMVRYLSAFLFGEPTHLVSTWMRGMEEPAERWTAESLGVPSRPDLPVLVLTSSRTFSAAESFTFGLRVHDRVTTVGERTGGGGHFGGTVSLPGGFVLFVPTGRTYDPRTGDGWEAEGIAPDVEVPAEEALRRAHEIALGASARGDAPLVGAWSGSLETPRGAQRFTVRLHSGVDGYEATLVEHERQREVLLDSVTVDGSSVRIEYAPPGVMLELQVTPDGTALEGAWVQDGQSLPLRLTRR